MARVLLAATGRQPGEKGPLPSGQGDGWRQEVLAPHGEQVQMQRTAWQFLSDWPAAGQATGQQHAMLAAHTVVPLRHRRLTVVIAAGLVKAQAVGGLEKDIGCSGILKHSSWCDDRWLIKLETQR